MREEVKATLAEGRTARRREPVCCALMREVLAAGEKRQSRSTSKGLKDHVLTVEEQEGCWADDSKCCLARAPRSSRKLREREHMDLVLETFAAAR